MKSIFDGDSKKEAETFVPAKQEIQVVSEPKAKVEATRTVVLDQENAYLRDVIDAQPRTIEDVEIKLGERGDPNFHRLTLPPEIKKYEDKFTFRWIFKNRRSIAEASQIRKWMFVNRTHFPDLPDHLFSTSGAVERGDNILAFTLKHIADEMRNRPIKQSQDMVKGKLGAHKNNPNFYVPTDGEDGESTKVVGL